MSAFKEIHEMQKFEGNTDYWWGAWKRAIAELYPLRDTIRRLGVEVKELRVPQARHH